MSHHILVVRDSVSEAVVWAGLHHLHCPGVEVVPLDDDGAGGVGGRGGGLLVDGDRVGANGHELLAESPLVKNRLFY